MLNNMFIDRYKISKCEKIFSWFQMIISFMALSINLLLLINDYNICNNIENINDIKYCISISSTTNIIVIFNMMIQPIIFMNGYNNLRLNFCSSKRIKYIENKIDNIYNDCIIDEI
jgi:hypothetical protein